MTDRDALEAIAGIIHNTCWVGNDRHAEELDAIAAVLDEVADAVLAVTVERLERKRKGRGQGYG